MSVVLAKWGNSVGLRIPNAVLQSLKLQVNDQVDVREEDGRIVIVPIRRKYDLASLIDGITPENRHDDVDFGPPVGREVW